MSPYGVPRIQLLTFAMIERANLGRADLEAFHRYASISQRLKKILDGI